MSQRNDLTKQSVDYGKRLHKSMEKIMPVKPQYKCSMQTKEEIFIHRPVVGYCRACQNTRFLKLKGGFWGNPCPFCSDSGTPDLDMMMRIPYYGGIDKDGKLVKIKMNEN